jgi:hypothetical protein
MKESTQLARNINPLWLKVIQAHVIEGKNKKAAYLTAYPDCELNASAKCSRILNREECQDYMHALSLEHQQLVTLTQRRISQLRADIAEYSAKDTDRLTAMRDEEKARGWVQDAAPTLNVNLVDQIRSGNIIEAEEIEDVALELDD